MLIHSQQLADQNHLPSSLLSLSPTAHYSPTLSPRQYAADLPALLRRPDGGWPAGTVLVPPSTVVLPPGSDASAALQGIGEAPAAPGDPRNELPSRVSVAAAGAGADGGGSDGSDGGGSRMVVVDGAGTVPRVPPPGLSLESAPLNATASDGADGQAANGAAAAAAAPPAAVDLASSGPPPGSCPGTALGPVGSLKLPPGDPQPGRQLLASMLGVGYLQRCPVSGREKNRVCAPIRNADTQSRHTLCTDTTTTTLNTTLNTTHHITEHTLPPTTTKGGVLLAVPDGPEGPGRLGGPPQPGPLHGRPLQGV